MNTDLDVLEEALLHRVLVVQTTVLCARVLEHGNRQACTQRKRR